MQHANPGVPGLTLLYRRGTGSTSEVYSARRDVDGWACAVKIVGAPGGEREAARREIDVLTAVRVPGLVRLYDVLPTGDGRLALILDLVDGGVLREVIAARGHLLVRETIGVLRVAFRVLAALHAHGVAHGDVSAGNVLISRDGCAVLGDVGSARLVGDHSREVRGTQGFVSPEVLVGGQQTPAADVYGVGVLAWLMLTGTLPGDAYGRRPLEESLPDCPAALVTLIAECLAGDPDRRPPASAALRVCDGLGPEEPLSLPDGPDLGGRLTHRLRWQVEELGAVAEEAPPAVEPVAGYREVVDSLWERDRVTRRAADGGAPEGGRHRGKASGRLDGMAAAAGRHATGGPGRVVVATVAGVLVGLLIWWGWGMWRDVPLPSFLAAARADPSPPTEAVAQPGPDLDADRGDPLTALPALLARRAEAYGTAEIGPLEGCYLAGSGGLDEARSEIERLRQARARYDGLAYSVQAARMVSREQMEDRDEARVSARVVTSPYRVVVAGSRPATASPSDSPASPSNGEAGEDLVYVLQRDGGRWRLAAIER